MAADTAIITMEGVYTHVASTVRFPGIQTGSLNIRHFRTLFAYFSLPCVRPLDNHGIYVAVNVLH